MRNIARDTLCAWLGFAIFLFIEQRFQGVNFSGWLYGATFGLSMAFAMLARWPKIGGTPYGGWLYALSFVAMLYISAFRPPFLTYSAIASAGAFRFHWAFEVLTHGAESFKDAYVVLATAAFTLFGIFFIVVRRVDTYIAVRLSLIAGSLLTTFVTTSTALLFTNDGWLRLAAIAASSATLLLGLTAYPRPWIADYVRESETPIAFWENWLKTRRGNAMFSLFGLAIMPIYPPVGEYLFFISMLTQVALAASGAAFLYLSDSTKHRPEFDAVLRALWSIRVSKETSDAVESMKKYKQRSDNVKRVFYLNLEPAADAKSGAAPDAGNA